MSQAGSNGATKFEEGGVVRADAGLLRFGCLAAALLAPLGADAAQRSEKGAEGAAAQRALEGSKPTQIAQVDASRTTVFDISPQDLDSALTAFADQAGLKIFYASDQVGGLRSPELRGAYRPDEALRRLLAGTGLRFSFASADTVTIVADSADRGPQRLAPVTVLGSRRADAPLSNVPSSITSVEREAIQRERATTNRIEDILARQVPGFNPTNNGVRQIRGRTAQVFVNGVPVNEQLRASSGSDLNILSPDHLAGIEVSRGANAAYGFGSPGGIIALQTPRAESEELTLRSVVRESINPHHIGGSHQASLYQSASQIIGKFDFHIGGSLAYDGADFDPDGDLALGFDNSALLTNGKEILGNLDGSFGLDLEEAGRLRLTGTYGYVDFVERYAINPGVYRQTYGSLRSEPRGDDSFRRSHTLNFTYEKDDLAGSAVKLEAFTSEVNTEVFTADGGNFRDEQTNTYYGARSAVTTPLAFLTEGAAVTYGLDFLRNNYFRPFFNDDTGAVVTFFSPDVTLDSYAPYAQVEAPLGKFLMSGGVRHEEYRGEVETAPGGIVGGDIRDFGLTLFNAGLVYFLNDAVELYGSFSQGAEITQLGRAARSATSADQIDPQPAKSDQYEIGLRGAWSNLTLGAAAFYTESDLLSALQCDGINPCTPLREPRKFWGVEGNVDWRIDDRWGVGGILTWQDGIRETAGGDTRRIGSRDVPPVLVTAYVDYSPFRWWRNRVQLNYRGSRDEFGDSTAFGEGRVEDLLLVNVSAAFDVGPGELQVGVKNLFNTEYTSIPAEADNFGFIWLPEEGTRASVGYSIKW